MSEGTKSEVVITSTLSVKEPGQIKEFQYTGKLLPPASENSRGGRNSGGGGGVYLGANGQTVEIRDVWASTLDEEMSRIRELVERYPYVAMDTEFPGVVAKPIGDAYSSGYQYQTLQCNVDLLKVIQLGMSFCDEKGKTPESGCFCYQFNFRFDLNEDMYAEDSIQLLKESGIDFARHASEGIDVHRFGELVMMSGLVLTEDIKWISFHSGYDFGYLIKLLTCTTLPSDEQAFFDLLHIYFPTLFDIKLLMSCVDGLHGGLQRVAEDLKVERVGPMHQAGSDSMLTNATFFRLAEIAFSGVDQIDDKFRGEIYGLGAYAYRGNNQNKQHASGNIDAAMNVGTSNQQHHHKSASSYQNVTDHQYLAPGGTSHIIHNPSNVVNSSQRSHIGFGLSQDSDLGSSGSQDHLA
mmetsp:Transcript_20792/g.26904  ORF Transcript_20792/g.26904 Transcript_20792/m.26904 type:complete len:408 (+) Transcript_20792:93-1316(+)|eukprot:CAMPEP_0197288706 /NCGR_PEP_ID=MMETSP0890-20130614/5867_1 /TAXON_ID=44058 ORGANISM="Aureoumbra lagunensis, Strain CCMP1510" /NCGR_SAMPLE_ID=MMETSP0890 /ASSEMBLY_ACC=CAM_ASM_000533 /LENGTH=407 /DNA_ID=CAMNT_0042759635 /DNA_START=91 /DNA_END=1314 /DNA_ORIENTATION=-